MLTLTRRKGERIQIGSDIHVKILSISRGRVRIGIDAPRELAVHRGELIDRVMEENQRAMGAPVNVQTALEHAITFPAGLFGLPDETSFVLCDTDEGDHFQAMVSVENPALQILVVDAELVWPDYPIEEAKIAAGLEDEEVAVAAVVTARPGTPPTVNLVAPLVIGLSTRMGKQQILDHDDLSVRHTLVAQGPGQMTAAPLS